jgi:hypothetical protein
MDGCLWIDNKPPFEEAEQIQLSAVCMMFDTLTGRIDPSLRRLETNRLCDYRRAFQTNEGGRRTMRSGDGLEVSIWRWR